MRKGIYAAIAASASGLVLIGLLASWGSYRWRYIVIDKASIKGTVTKLGARLDGQVRSVNVQVGERISKGQVLARLDDQHLKASIKRVEAELLSARREYAIEALAIRHDRRALELAIDKSRGLRLTANADVAAVQARVEEGEQEYQRIGSLIQGGIAAGSQLDVARSKRDQARADMFSAEGRKRAADAAYDEAGLHLEGLTIRQEGLRVLTAKISVIEERIATIQADIDATIIRAPGDGWVSQRIVESGGSVKVGDPILSVWTGDLWVEAWARESILKHVRIGTRSEISLKAFPDEILTGRVTTYGVLTDREMLEETVPSDLRAVFRKESLVPVRIHLSSAPAGLQPGLSATVGIRKGTSPKVLTYAPITLGTVTH